MRLWTLFIWCVAILSESGAQDVYYEDFSSEPVVKTTTNANSCYAGAGDSASNHLNANEWMVRDRKFGSVVHNAGCDAVDIMIKNNVCLLLDLSVLEGASGAETAYYLSFDVDRLVGKASLFAFAGSGLAYSGIGQGHLFYRIHGNPPSVFEARQGSTAVQVIDGATTTILEPGLFQTTLKLVDAGRSGAYLFIGFTGSGAMLTIDNLRISTSAEVPPRPARSQPPAYRDESPEPSPASSPATLGLLL